MCIHRRDLNTSTQFRSEFKYPAENHPTAQYEQGFKHLNNEELKFNF